MLDVEMMAIPVAIYRELGLEAFRVDLNSIGCPECRPAYRRALQEYFASRTGALCGTCLHRLERNPLRVLDCKEPSCREAGKDAPKSYEHLCDACAEHFAEVQKGLDALGLEYRIDHRLVRGLDYYTRTVFELVGLDLGAQDALGGGGRYDGLVEACGGPPTPAVGFAAGMERVLLSLAATGQRAATPKPAAFIAVAGDAGRLKALELAFRLRAAGYSAEMDYTGRSLKAQLRAAQKAGVDRVIILGDDELAAGLATVKDLATGEQRQVAQDKLIEVIQGGNNVD